MIPARGYCYLTRLFVFGPLSLNLPTFAYILSELPQDFALATEKEEEEEEVVEDEEEEELVFGRPLCCGFHSNH